MSMNESEFDNLLVRMKDQIINLINDGFYLESIKVLLVVKELFYSHTYDYKWIELRARLETAIKEEFSGDEEDHVYTILMNHFNELY